MGEYVQAKVKAALAARFQRIVDREDLGYRSLSDFLARAGVRLAEVHEAQVPPPSPPPAAAPIAEPRATAPQAVPPPAPAPADADEGRGRSPRGRPRRKKAAELEDDDDVGEAPEPPKGSWTCPDCAEAMPWLDKVNHDCPALRRGPAGTNQATIAAPPSVVDLDLGPVKARFREEAVFGRTRAGQLSWLRSQFKRAGAKAPPEDEAKEILEAWIEELRPAPKGRAVVPPPTRFANLKLDTILSFLREFNSDAKRSGDARAYFVAGIVRKAAEQDVELTEADAADLLARLKPEVVA